MPGGGDAGAERAVALAAFDEGRQDGENWLVDRVEVGVGESGVDLDEGVEAAEVAPRGGHDPFKRFHGVAVGGFGGVDGLRDLGDRAFGDGGDERFAGREVHVDRRADHARPASDLGHAGVGIARQRREGGVKDAVEAALRVGAAGRAGERHQCTETGGESRSFGRKLAAEGRMASASTLATPARVPATRKASPMPLASAAAEPCPPSDPVAIVARTAMPSEPPISCPVVLRPESIPVWSCAAPVSTETETPTSATPRPTPAISMPGSRSAA